MGDTHKYDSFFDSIGRITSPSYVPTYTDLLYLRKHARDIPKKGIPVSEVKITLPRLNYNFTFCAGSPEASFAMRKWMPAFEDSMALVFLVELPCCFSVREEAQHPHDLVGQGYNDYLDDTVFFFETIINSFWLRRCTFILVFSDVQAFRDRVESMPLTGIKWHNEHGGPADNVLLHIIARFDYQIDHRSEPRDNMFRKIITTEPNDYVQKIDSVIQDILFDAKKAELERSGFVFESKQILSRSRAPTIYSESTMTLKTPLQ